MFHDALAEMRECLKLRTNLKVKMLVRCKCSARGERCDFKVLFSPQNMDHVQMVISMCGLWPLAHVTVVSLLSRRNSTPNLPTRTVKHVLNGKRSSTPLSSTEPLPDEA
uniref:Uncharacterized protein n=1 Tax=Hyaloperonospora arabidopsidis (strain Emoy2) TaxID=559515 RepID=M4BYK8_HYAAE